MKKTWSSEIAIALLTGWAALTAYIFGWVPAEEIANYENVFNNVTMVTLPTAFTALGFKRHVEARSV